MNISRSVAGCESLGPAGWGYPYGVTGNMCVPGEYPEFTLSVVDNGWIEFPPFMQPYVATGEPSALSDKVWILKNSMLSIILCLSQVAVAGPFDPLVIVLIS